MAQSCSDPFCGCHEPGALFPFAVHNRPGLGALSYRIGTFSTMRQFMLEAIAKAPALAQLTSREPDDYAISLLEAFAAMGDVLTFYGERFANEYYLGTSVQRASVQRLVRLIGHELSPGLAATALMAFELEPGAQTKIRKGLPIMSIPGQDEVPQTYETIEELVAHGDLNAPRAFALPIALDAFAVGRTRFALAQRPRKLATGDTIVIFDGTTIEEKRIEAITAVWGGLALDFAPAMQTGGIAAERSRVRRLERRMSLFGANAPTSVQLYSTDPTIEPANRWSTHSVNDSVAPIGGFYPLETQIKDLAAGTLVVIDPGTAGSRQVAASVASVRDSLATIRTTSNLDVPQLAQTVTLARFSRSFAGRPAIVGRAGAAQIVARDGANGAISFPPTAAGEHVIGSLSTTGNPALVATTTGASMLFVRNAQRNLVEAARAGDPWAVPVNRGGVLTTDPAAIALGNGEIEIFGRGLDSALWVIGVGASPHGWTWLGGIITSMPAVASWGGARLDVFARGADRALWFRTRNGAWSPWTTLDGTLASPPAVVAPAANRLDVVARSDDGTLVHRRFVGDRWTDWTDLGGDVAGTPAIVALGADSVGVMVRRPDGGLGFIARTGNGWSNWETIEGHLASDPSAAIVGTTLTVVGRNEDTSIATITRSGSVWGSWVRQDAAVSISLDRRQSRILQIGTEAITPRGFDYPLQASGGQLVVPSAPGTARLAKGRRILVEAGEVHHFATVTGAAPLAAIAGEMPDHVLVDFDPPLPRPVANAVLKGNIANASHGETQADETLGHGDASKIFAEFTLGRAPLTHLPQAGSLTGAAALEVRVNGVLWSPVPSLYGTRPASEIYALRTGDDGSTTISFGDGRTGRRLPTGPLAVTARYRKGLGLKGRMQAGQLALPLERPVGLKAVSNPMPSIGGDDPEDRDAARETAPNQVRTFGRAVSLQDFEWLALSTRLVARAAVTWVWLGLQKAVHLSVLGADGVRLPADGLAGLDAAMSGARDPNWPLFLSNITRVPLTISARILCDPRFERDVVMANARAALFSAFAFEAVTPGMPVHASHVYAALQDAEGVVAVDVDVFNLKGYAGLTPAERSLRAVDSGPLQQHVRLFLARALPNDPALIDRYARRGFDNGVTPRVLAAEQAFIEDPRDVTLTSVEAL